MDVFVLLPLLLLQDGVVSAMPIAMITQKTALGWFIMYTS